jgi:hypothetical protein
LIAVLKTTRLAKEERVARRPRSSAGLDEVPGRPPSAAAPLHQRSLSPSGEVTGIDFVDEAIRMARRKAAERGLTIEFQVKDAMTLEDWDKRFATVIDMVASAARRLSREGLSS